MGDLLKHSRVGSHQDQICLKAYAPDRRLCIVTVLKEYLSRTRFLRVKGNTRLFIRFIKPHSPVSRDTISRWVKSTMQSAGVDVSIFSPHSVRSSATSAAARGYVPLDTILRTAGWSQENTFTKYYKRKIVNDTLFSDSILRQNEVAKNDF